MKTSDIVSPSVSAELQPDSVAEGDYLAPPDHNITHDPQQARRRIALALVCFLTLPLCACSFSWISNGRSLLVLNIGIYLLLGATFAFPFYILGRYQKGYIKSNQVWAALGLLGMSITLIVLRSKG